MIDLTKEEKQILLHSLGLSNIDFYNEYLIDSPYRNNFYTSENTTDYPIIKSLIEKGLMQDTNKGWEKGSRYFIVTEKGIEISKKLAKEFIPKITRSKKRYSLYLHSESSESFIEWLKNPYYNDYRKRYGV